MTRRQVIVVVHGVGVREAGAATGQLSAVLTGDGTEAEAGLPPWKPHSTDDFLLHEDVPPAEASRLMRVFPAHLRRFRRFPGGAGDQAHEERVIADFYWGDVSGTGPGGVKLLTGLARIILGLSHAIRENAWEVFPGDRPAERVLRAMARAAALVIHGPVAAINFVLLAGVALTLVWHTLNGRALASEPQPELGPFWTELVLGIGSIGLGLVLRNRAQVFLLRHLGLWTAVVGGAVIAVAFAQWLRPDWALEIGGLVAKAAAVRTGWAEGASPEELAHGFAVPAAVLMAGMVAAWVLALTLGWVLRLAIWTRGKPAGVTSFVPEAVALMAVMWMLLMTVIWAAVVLVHWVVERATSLQPPAGLGRDLVQTALSLVTPAFVAVAGLVVVGLALQWQKATKLGVGRFKPGDYLPQRETLAERHRLIVAPALLMVLNGFLVLVAAFFLVFLFWDCSLPGGLECRQIRDANSWALPYLVPLAGVLGLALALGGQRGVATGVAIVTDVLAYLNDYSWTTREMARGRGLIAPPPGSKTGYWLKHRIHIRMRTLMNRLIDDEAPEEIVVVAHSQGTVIALDVIDAEAAGWRARLGGKLKLKLVTMGSPYTHLYTRYFPSVFKQVPDRPVLARGGELAEWANIFRVDDFVGTHVDCGTEQAELTWPQEHPVGAGGHTNYWVDTDVFKVLRRVLAFGPSDRK